MAATTETVTSAGVHTSSVVLTGGWTCDSSKGDHTITLPRNVRFICCVLDATATNPLMLMKHTYDTTDTQLTTGSSGIITSPTDATGITITNATGGSGTTVLVDSNSQVNSGVNYWFAFCTA